MACEKAGEKWLRNNVLRHKRRAREDDLLNFPDPTFSRISFFSASFLHLSLAFRPTDDAKTLGANGITDEK